MCMISLLTYCMGHAGAPGVLASPFAAMHGLGSPLTSPYGNSAVGGMGGMHFNTLFCSLLFSPLLFKLCCPILWYSFDAWTTIFQILYSLPSFLAIYYGFLTWLSAAVRTCQNFYMLMLWKEKHMEFEEIWVASVMLKSASLSSADVFCYSSLLTNVGCIFVSDAYYFVVCLIWKLSLLVLVASFFVQRQQPVSL